MSKEDNAVQWVRAYIGLGSNDGDCVGNIQQAMQLLKDHPHIEVVECSSLYEAEPVGIEYMDWFVNAVAAIETDLKPDELLDACQEIEFCLAKAAGSESAEIYREIPDGKVKSRIIDLDILFYDGNKINNSRLVVPHPNLAKRAYALVPLLEIAPDFVHPTLQKTVSELHDDLDAPEQIFLYGTRDIVSDFGA